MVCHSHNTQHIHCNQISPENTLLKVKQEQRNLGNQLPFVRDPLSGLLTPNIVGNSNKHAKPNIPELFV
jgi:hypothetical protein